MNNNYGYYFSITRDRVNLSLIKKMKKTTKSLKIRHHQQTIKRIEILINTKCIRKNVGKVLAALSSYANKDGKCFPSQSTISKVTGYTRETVNRLIKKLTEQGFIFKSDNRQPIFIKDKVYLPRTIYRINIAKITKMLKVTFDTSKKLKMIEDAKYKMKKDKLANFELNVKTDHSAPPKNDHTINSIKLLKKNTTLTASPSRKFSLLENIFKTANQHEDNHLRKLKLRAARTKGIKAWQISNGQRKSDNAIKQERKAGSIMRKARQTVKPLLDTFTRLQTKLMQWNAKVNLNAFTNDDYKALESIKSDMQANKLQVPVNVIADYKLNEFIAFNR